MPDREYMKSIVDLKNILRTYTLRALHLTCLDLIRGNSLLIEFSNGARMYIRDDGTGVKLARKPLYDFIPMESLNLLGTMFINEKSYTRKIKSEDVDVFKFLNIILQDEGIKRVQVTIDKDNEFLKEFDANNFVFKNMIIVRR